MIYEGMEQAAQGMIAMRAMQDLISNNLANANTAGFQEDALVVSDFSRAYAEAMGWEAIPAGFTPAGGGISGDTQLLFKTVTKFEQGRLKNTNQPFDLAIEGKGLFTIEARDGARYTRNGNFSVNGEGFLVTKEGGRVLGEHGPIQIQGENFRVKPDGTVLADKKEIDKLRIMWIDPSELSKVGSNDFKTLNPMSWHATDQPKILQGHLEMSNVNAIKEMVRMLTVGRAFEASQKLMQIEDQMAQRANQVGQFGK